MVLKREFLGKRKDSQDSQTEGSARLSKPEVLRRDEVTKIAGARTYCYSIMDDQARIRDKSLEKRPIDFD